MEPESGAARSFYSSAERRSRGKVLREQTPRLDHAIWNPVPDRRDPTAPWEWDIKRLAASFVVAGRLRRFSDDNNQAAVLALAGSYQEHLGEYASKHVLDVWYSRLGDQTLIAVAPNTEAREYRHPLQRHRSSF